MPHLIVKDYLLSCVSIVAVTGLAGHAYGSWRHRDTKSMWLHDFLPDTTDIKGRVRIMIYGYNTAIQKSNSRSTSGIMDFAEDLISRLKTARVSVSWSIVLQNRSNGALQSRFTKMLIIVGRTRVAPCALSDTA